MEVKDLQARQGNVDVVLDVVDVGEVREFDKFGKKGRVSTAIVKDSTGDVKLTLWNEQIDQIKAGDKIHITNGYVNEWQGEKQLTTGKFGKLEVVGESEETKEEMTAPPNEAEDKKKRELIDARNQAEALAYSAEKALKDAGDKVPEDVKKDIELKIETLKKAIEGEDKTSIENSTKELSEALQKIGEVLYKESNNDSGEDTSGGGDSGEKTEN